MTVLNDDLIKNLLPQAKAYMVFDERLAGFSLRMNPNSSCYYYFQYRQSGKVKRLNLGSTLEITPEEALSKALEFSKTLKPDFSSSQSSIPKAPSMMELFNRYTEEHAKIYCKARTVTAYQWLINKYLVPFFKDYQVTKVSRSDVVKFHLSLKDTPYNANRCLEVISKAFRLAELWELRPEGTNPCKQVKKFPMKARQRYLIKEEVARLTYILEHQLTVSNANHAAIFCIQLLLLTGCRLSEIQTLRWEFIHVKQGVINLPDSKTGAKTVYLGKQALELLERIEHHPERPKNNPYVIWGRIPKHHLADIQSAWQRYRKMASLEDVRIHDLRHTFASFAVSHGVSLEMIGKLLGHKQVQTTARYAHLMSEPIFKAANQITDQINFASKSR